jgi:hypothetical protein
VNPVLLVVYALALYGLWMVQPVWAVLASAALIVVMVARTL